MIIDTMVMAYAMLGVPEVGGESAAVLEKADEIAAPASAEGELLNVVWQWGRNGGDPELAAGAYCTASRLWTELIPVESLWAAALEIALARGHSPYDTLFVAAARLRQTQVVTYDKKLLALFPKDTITAQEALRY